MAIRAGTTAGGLRAATTTFEAWPEEGITILNGPFEAYSGETLTVRTNEEPDPSATYAGLSVTLADITEDGDEWTAELTIPDREENGLGIGYVHFIVVTSAADAEDEATTQNTLQPEPDVHVWHVIDGYDALEGSVTEEALGTTDANGDIAGTLAETYSVAGTISITIGTETITDDGNGTLTGDELASGTIDYQTSEYSITGAAAETSAAASYSFNRKPTSIWWDGDDAGSVTPTDGWLGIVWNPNNLTDLTVDAAGIASADDFGDIERQLFDHESTEGVDGQYTEVGTVTVEEDGDVLGVPVNLSGSATSSQITWTWESVEGATGYIIEYGPQGGAYSTEDVGDNLSYTQTGLTGLTTYEARVRAYDLEGNGSYSSFVQVTTEELPSITPRFGGQRVSIPTPPSNTVTME